VPMYLVMLALALGLGTAVALERGARDGLSRRRMLALSIAGALAGGIGARLWSVVFEVGPLVGSVDLREAAVGGGYSVVGGLLGGLVAFAAGARVAGVPFLRCADAAAPGVAAGISVGRVGCLLAGCCYGQPTLFPIALVFDDLGTAARPIGVPLHATQVYESVGAAVLCVILWRLPSEPRGLRLAALGAGYGLLRCAVELLRADYRGYVWGVPATALAAGLLAVVAGAMVLVIVARAAREPRRAART